MKRNSKKIAAIAIFSLAVFALAQSANAETTASTTSPAGKHLPARIQKLKTNMDARRDERNVRLEERQASSTEAREARHDEIKKLRRDIFEIRRNTVVKELNNRLDDLTSLQTRALARLSKMKTAGRDVGAAEVLFATANDKLNQAKLDVAAFSAQIASATPSAPASSTDEVDLTHPRQAANTASQSIKSAREALKKAIVALAKTSGKHEGEEGRDATSTATSTSN